MELILGGKTRAACVCDCGKQVVVTVNNLKSGNTSSCGCLRSELLSSRRVRSPEERYKLKRQRESLSKRWLDPRYKLTRSKWIAANRDKINEKKSRYHRLKRMLDPCYRLRRAIRNRFKAALRGRYKSGSAVEHLGCSVEELKTYLESKFYPHPETGEMMTWDNYGSKWHIDHVKPLSSFDLSSLEQVKAACHYTNLQPMWAIENIRKGTKYE